MIVKKNINLLFVFLSVCFLSGCLYPSSQLEKNQVPYDSQVASVQDAVDSYQLDNNGLLPIKTRDADTDMYQKYPIDFHKITPKYMAEPPGSAYENGGYFMYVLVDVEENPTVKLVDIRMADKIHTIQIRLDAYRDVNGHYPFSERVSGSVYRLNYEELGFEEVPQVKSPYSGEYLPLVIDVNTNDIYVDYSLDLYQELQQMDGTNKNEDIRYILSENSFFVPAFSLPYTVNEQGEPIFFEN
ncbi:hypothetical protein LC087_06335 [Bacillus carboniphilus]|uniref:ABC transporter periplasmic binding protein yphF n=1 Tax=Bacillus carboniphilus TaxID=86663 RepID=A0ABY9JWH2_9BACI|nr:hypothetical protein [Bacillus carboniphilus]WLR43746.1 hypothetical protein LC087_06335 [Bacillus carboniphilus]